MGENVKRFNLFSMKKSILILALLSTIAHAQKLPVDKVAHFGVGFVSSSMTTAILTRYDVKRPALIGFGFGFALGVGKEISDIYTGGSPEFKDACATILGSALGCVTIKISIK